MLDMSEMHARKTTGSYSLNPTSRKVEPFLKTRTMPLSPSNKFESVVTVGENSIASIQAKQENEALIAKKGPVRNQKTH